MYHCVDAVLHIHSLDPVADPEFIMGVPPPQKKMNFYLKRVCFGAF